MSKTPEQIEVLALGSKVLIGQHKTTEAVVVGITIRRGRIQYEVEFWEDNMLTQLYLEDFQFDHAGSPKMLKVNLSLS